MNDAPEDDEVRESYNFAPGYHGLVYRADVPDHGLREEEHRDGNQDESVSETESQQQQTNESNFPKKPQTDGSDVSYHLKAMRWGLIPFWTKRSPDYGSMMRTINCRDDSLIENKGMWTTMKKHKRCIVICQGFYEWLKKGPGGKEKIPHFVKKKDGQLMCFAGLWDCAKYDDAEQKLYTYTIITTDSNKQLKFLHDRMPVIFDIGSDAMKTWLDPTIHTWSKDMQRLLKPYEGELDCYPVIKDVGKVGNNSPDFIVPVDSKENKKNIANFFANAKSAKGKPGDKNHTHNKAPLDSKVKIEHEDDDRETTNQSGTEDNAPLPVPSTETRHGQKRPQSPEENQPATKAIKLESSPSNPSQDLPIRDTDRKTRSAVSNGTVPKGPSPKKAGDGSQRITSFFGK